MDILIVDDSRATRESLVALLREQPEVNSVREAASAAQAITILGQAPPDVVVLDLQMSGPQGFRVLEAAKRMGLRAPVVIVFTSYATGRYRLRAQQLGADFFFDKASGVRNLLGAIGGASAVQ